MIFQSMIRQQLMMFLLMLIGYLIRKRGVVGTEGRKDMVNFCLYVTLPFNILHSFMGEQEQGMLVSFGIVLLLSIGNNLIAIASNFILYRRYPKSQQPPMKYATLVSNGGFLGNPILEGIYGQDGLFYGSVYMIPVRIAMWTVGISYFMSEKKKGVLKQLLTHPCLVAVYAGGVLMGTGIELPSVIHNTVNALSSCNTPLSMMLVGMIMGEISPKGLIKPSMIYYAVIRLVFLPGLTYVFTAFLSIDATLRGIAVIIAAMPAPVTTALLAAKYGSDEKYGTGLLFVSTLLSMVTLSLWCLLL